MTIFPAIQLNFPIEAVSRKMRPIWGLELLKIRRFHVPHSPSRPLYAITFFTFGQISHNFYWSLTHTVLSSVRSSQNVGNIFTTCSSPCFASATVYKEWENVQCAVQIPNTLRWDLDFRRSLKTDYVIFWRPGLSEPGPQYPESLSDHSLQMSHQHPANVKIQKLHL